MRIFTMNRSRARIAFLSLLPFVSAFCLAPSGHAATPPDAPPVFLIQNATVMTVSHGTIEHGSILIKDGKIAEVGQSIKAPAGAQVIDASGQFVVPGIIVACMLYVAVPVCVIEKAGVFESLNRSGELTRGYRWQIFALWALVTVIAGIAQIVLSWFVGVTLWGKLLTFGWQVFAAAFGAVLVAVIYHDLRVTKEGIDIDSLANVFD